MKNRVLRHILGDLAILSLGVCLGAAVLFFLGRISGQNYKSAFLAASIAWFMLMIGRGEKGKDRPAG